MLSTNINLIISQLGALQKFVLRFTGIRQRTTFGLLAARTHGEVQHGLSLRVVPYEIPHRPVGESASAAASADPGWIVPQREGGSSSGLDCPTSIVPDPDDPPREMDWIAILALSEWSNPLQN